MIDDGDFHNTLKGRWFVSRQKPFPVPDSVSTRDAAVYFLPAHMPGNLPEGNALFGDAVTGASASFLAGASGRATPVA
jgi:hypothetical protein